VAGGVTYARHAMAAYRFVDCRWELGKPELGRDQYLAAHIPGAAFLDVEQDLSAPPVEGGARHPLPSSEAFAEAAGRAGIGPGVFVVAYGSMGGAERLWWLLRHFGHDDVAVLGGGIDSWLGPLDSGDEETDQAVFEPRARTDDTVDADEVTARLGDRGVAFVDARLADRFRGEPNPVDRVPGRIPGAVNVPWNGDGELPPSLLDAEELIVYCGSGVTACVPLFALARAGRPDAKLYAGSWSDWESRNLPVERG
jgi:thiosulfate/3-mercaptopyruvate sulfurtransferase